MRNDTPLKLMLLFPPLTLVAGLIPAALELGGANFFPNVVLSVGLAGIISLPQLVHRFRRGVLRPSYSKLLGVLMVLYVVSIAHALNYQNYGKSFAYLIAYVGSIATYFIVANALYSSRARDQWSLRFARSYVIMAFGLTLIYLFPGGGDLLRVSLLQFNRNDYAMIAAQALGLIFGYLFIRGSKSITHLVVTVSLLIGLMASNNRGALLGLGAGAAAVLLLSPVITMRKRFFSILTLGIVVTFLIASQHRVVQSLVSPDEYQDIARVAILGIAKQVFFNHWAVGVGVGNYWTAYMDTVNSSSTLMNLPSNIFVSVYETARPPHNLYLRVGSELGVFGALVVVFANLTAIRHFYLRLRRGMWLDHAGLIYCVTFTIHSIFYEGYIYPFHFILIAVLMFGECDTRRSSALSSAR